MNRRRNHEKERQVWLKVVDYIVGGTNRIAHEVHVSDFGWCLRQSFYKKMFPLELSPELVYKFYKGKISEEGMTNHVFPEYAAQDTLTYDNLVAHPDIISDDEVIELKYTDNNPNSKFDPIPGYTAQILYYMYMSRRNRGQIVISYANPPAGETPFQVHEVTIDERDRGQIGIDIHFKKDLLQDAIDKEKVGFLPKLVNVDINQVSKCGKCPYRERCDNEPDYWERLQFDKRMAGRNFFDMLKDPDYEYFRLHYDGQPIAKTSVNYLFNLL